MRRTVVLVEGVSDRVAVETLARLRGRDLGAEDVVVVPIGGAQAIASFVDRIGPRGHDARLAGLCDAGEERHFRAALGRAGLGAHLTRERMAALGFYVCDADLEDELIRPLGADAVESVLAAEGDLASFRTLQKQPAWRGRPPAEQLRRFLGSGGSRKIRMRPCSFRRSISPVFLLRSMECSSTSESAAAAGPHPATAGLDRRSETDSCGRPWLLEVDFRSNAMWALPFYRRVLGEVGAPGRRVAALNPRPAVPWATRQTPGNSTPSPVS